jgi:hypothetical protein
MSTRTMATWISFSHRLPTRADANSQGYVQGLLASGQERECLWDWIPAECPSHLRGNKDWQPYSAAAVWSANGWTHWRPLA